MNRFFSHRTALFLTGLLLGFSPLPALAQMQKEQVSGAGTFKEAAPPLMQIQNASGQPVVIHLNEIKPQDLSFTGAADASFLKVGMCVQFSALVNKRMQVTEPVADVTVFVPREGQELSIAADNVGGGVGAGDLFNESKEKEEVKKPVKGKKPIKADMAVAYRVAGEITKITKAGEMTITADGVSVKAKLADKAKISLDMASLDYAVAGDKVEYKGWCYKEHPEEVWVHKLEISAAKPLEDEGKKKITKTDKTGKKEMTKEGKEKEAKGKDAKGGEKEADKKDDEKKPDDAKKPVAKKAVEKQASEKKPAAKSDDEK